MAPLLKNLGLAVLATMICVFVFLQVTGPRGVSSLLEKQRRISAMQEENARIEQEIRERRERIQRLEDSQEEQELEIRKRFRLQKPDTVDFYIPPPEGGPAAQ